MSEPMITTADAGEQTVPVVEQAPVFQGPASQAELDRIIQTRLERERARFSDYDDLKAKVDAQKSEAERAVENARAEGAQSVTAKYQKRLFEAEVRTHAGALKFRDATDALSGFGDYAGLVSDDGVVDGDAIQKRLTEIAAQKPYLVDAQSTVAKRPTLKSRGTKTTDDQAKPSKAADALRAFAAGR